MAKKIREITQDNQNSVGIFEIGLMTSLAPVGAAIGAFNLYGGHGIGGGIAGAIIGAAVGILCARLLVKVIHEIKHMIATCALAVVILALLAWYFWDVGKPTMMPEQETPEITRPS